MWTLVKCSSLSAVRFTFALPGTGIFNRNFRQCIIFHKHRYPPLNENEIEEKFVRSGGPGGQNVNKRSSCVQLRHVPTGIIIKCQEERSQEANRQRARALLQEQLDVFFNGDDSIIAKEKTLYLVKKAQKHIKAKKRLEILLSFREREKAETKASISQEAGVIDQVPLSENNSSKSL